MFDHHDAHGLPVACDDTERALASARGLLHDAAAEITRLRGELADANGKVELLMYGDAHMQSRIWLNEECARLKGERDEARAALEGATEEWGVRAEDGHITNYGLAKGDEFRAFIDREYSHGVDHGEVVRRYRTSWQAADSEADRG